MFCCHRPELTKTPKDELLFQIKRPEEQECIVGMLDLRNETQNAMSREKTERVPGRRKLPEVSPVLSFYSPRTIGR